MSVCKGKFRNMYICRVRMHHDIRYKHLWSYIVLVFIGISIDAPFKKTSWHIHTFLKLEVLMIKDGSLYYWIWVLHYLSYWGIRQYPPTTRYGEFCITQPWNINLTISNVKTTRIGPLCSGFANWRLEIAWEGCGPKELMRKNEPWRLSHTLQFVETILKSSWVQDLLYNLTLYCVEMCLFSFDFGNCRLSMATM